MKVNATIRDGVPAMVEASGRKISVRTMTPAEHNLELKRKLLEESCEFMTTEDVKELADLIEVIYTLAAIRGINVQQLEQMRVEKRQKNGGYDGRTFCEEIVGN